MTDSKDVTFPEENLQHCPLCGSHQRHEVAQAQDKRFGYGGTFHAFECQQCGVLYLGNRVSEDCLHKLYSAFYKTSQVGQAQQQGWLSKHVKQLARGVYPDTLKPDFFKSANRVLEIGPGMRPIHDRFGWQGQSYLAVEYDEKACEYLRGRFGADAVHSQLEALLGLPEADKPDCCVADQVLEHVYDPVAFLNTIKQIIKPSGRIVLATPNGESRLRQRYGNDWIGWHAPYHVMLHTRQSITRLASDCGLRVASIESSTPGSWMRLQKRSAGQRYTPLDLVSTRALDLGGHRQAPIGDNLMVSLTT